MKRIWVHVRSPTAVPGAGNPWQDPPRRGASHRVTRLCSAVSCSVALQTLERSGETSSPSGRSPKWKLLAFRLRSLKPRSRPTGLLGPAAATLEPKPRLKGHKRWEASINELFVLPLARTPGATVLPVRTGHCCRRKGRTRPQRTPTSRRTFRDPKPSTLNPKPYKP